ncbi:hypothetical protein, partial [Pseudomonas sp. PNPG3]|uniref:PIN domain-containing protein n=1 Tax=Pseudomonas sp. PNPG3 TaxID=2919497 RepID=UPI001FFCF868
ETLFPELGECLGNQGRFTWTDEKVAKSWLVKEGVEGPCEVVLDAYSIAYLALTCVVDQFLAAGITFVLPSETKEILERWVADMTHKDFLSLGFTDSGRMVPHTASDIQKNEGHIIRGLQRILDKAVIKHPANQDTALELYAMRDVVDHTVYLAMQLSSVNDLAWLCMDLDFAGVHQAQGFKVANAHLMMFQASRASRFNFEERRHSLLLFARGAIPLPVTQADLDGLASNPNPLSSYILYKIFQKFGNAIFVETQLQHVLLPAMIRHAGCTFNRRNSVAWPSYTPWRHFEEHVFNHGLWIFITGRREKTAEYWLAVALRVTLRAIPNDVDLALYLVELFSAFVVGHFLDEAAVIEHYRALN